MSSVLPVLAVTVAVALAEFPGRPANQRPAGPAGQRTSEPPVPAPAAAGVSGAIEPSQPSGPFQKLFTAAANEARLQERLRAHSELQRAIERTAPKIVCGMLILRPDPTVDPKMIVRPSEQAGTMHIRKIPPPACAE